jgi:transcriptional regulator with XRE-family HTH domain
LRRNGVLAAMDYGREEKLLKELGNKLRAIRLERGLSLRELANKADMDHNNINRIEMGTVNPSYTTFILLAEALEIDPGQLISG